MQDYVESGFDKENLIADMDIDRLTNDKTKLDKMIKETSLIQKTMEVLRAKLTKGAKIDKEKKVKAHYA